MLIMLINITGTNITLKIFKLQKLATLCSENIHIRN